MKYQAACLVWVVLVLYPDAEKLASSGVEGPVLGGVLGAAHGAWATQAEAEESAVNLRKVTPGASIGVRAMNLHPPKDAS